MSAPTDPVQSILQQSGAAPTHAIITPIENVFDSLGMMDGSMSPVYRALFGFTVGTGAMYAIRPSISFDQNGSPRPWSYVRNQPGVSTALPWWLPGAVLAILSGVFV